jgi:endonuclease/exonuclease/phosphatase family metal-dependent hydrolase
MPGNLMPTREDENSQRVPWYDGDAGEFFRLASKGIWDIPVKLPNGARVHIIASHPCPPAFDGAEARNRRRNHDEIRFVADYIDDAQYVVDDKGTPGGLPASAHFIILGDLNADPDEGNAINDPIGALLFGSRHIGPDPKPVSDVEIPGLDPDDTAMFRLRADYVLPSKGLRVMRSGVWRHPPSTGDFPSDHFPVWADIVVPAGRE